MYRNIQFGILLTLKYAKSLIAVILKKVILCMNVIVATGKLFPLDARVGFATLVVTSIKDSVQRKSNPS